MKKLLTYVVAIATIVWSLGLGAVVPMAAAAYSPEAGDIIRTADSPAVYYIGADGKRHLFVNRVTYGSWLANFDDLQYVTSDELTDIAPGANVTVRPGTNLIKFQTNTNLYAVAPGGVLHKVSADTAAALYGAGYASRVITIQDGFESNYTVGAELTSSSKLPDGSLVKYEGSEDVYYIEDGQKRPLEGDAFVANGFRDSFVVTIPASMAYDNGESITGEEDALTAVAGSGGSGDPAVGGSITVNLSASTPASKTLLQSQALADVLVFDLVNNSSADATVDAFVIERGGLSTNSGIASIAAFEGSLTGTQIGNNKTLNSDNRVTFTDDVVVPAGTTKKVVVAVNLAASLTTYATDAPKLGLYSITMKSGSANASLPIWGNVMNYNSSVAIASATVAFGSSDPSTDNTPKVGDKDIELTEIKITNGSATEEMQLEKVVMRQAGTVSDGDVDEYKLVDSSNGTIVATAKQVSKYITFVPSTPLNIGKGKNVSLMVKTNEIVDGSSRTIQLDVYKNTDILVKGLTYNAYVIPTYPASSQPYLDQTISQTIGNGTVKVEPSNSFVAANIAEGLDGVQIGEWLFTVKGESVDITNIEGLITVTGTGNNGDITNGVFYDVDSGKVLTGANDPATAGAISGVTSTDTITLGVGIHKIGLKVDLNSDFEANDTIQVSIDPDDYLTITGNVTGNTITPTPSSAQSSSLMTVKTAKLSVSVSPNPPAQTVIRGDTVEAAKITLDASASGDDLKISQLKTVIHTTNMSPDELSNLTLWDGSTELATTNDPVPTSAVANDAVTTTWTLAQNLVITKGTVKILSIKATTGGSTSANDKFAIGLQSGCTVTAKDSQGEDAAITYTYSDGQLMTIQTTGTLTITRSDEYSSGILVGNSDGLSVGKFTANATHGGVDVEKIYVDVAAVNSGGTDELRGLYLYDGATLLSTATLTSSNQGAVLFNMESNPLEISANSSKELTIKVDTAVIANDGTATNGTANTGFTLSIPSGNVTAKTSGNTATVTSATLTFPSYRVLKSVPTVVIASSGDKVTGNSTYDLIDVTVSANAKGPVGLYKMTFQVSTTTVSASSYEVYEGGTLVATEAAAAGDGIYTYYMDDGSGSEVVEVYFNLGGSLGGRLREIAAGSSKTYTLRASVTGYSSSVSNGVSTSMAGDNADDATNYYKSASTIDGLQDADFIWSDLSYGNTSTTATTTAQWLNGFELDSSSGFLGTTSSAKAI